MILEESDIILDKDKGDNVNKELAENGADNIEIEDVGLWTFSGKLVNRLICVRMIENVYK